MKVAFRLALTLAATLAACTEPPPAPAPVGTGEVQPPATPDFASPAWAATSPEDVVVARVGGVAITRATLDRHLAESGGRPPAEVLRRLVEREALAQEAQRRGLGTAPDVAEAWRQALVQTWLDEGFEKDHGPERIPIAEVERIYQIPNIRKVYDHEHAYRMVHLAIVCCNPRNGGCERPEVAPCFEDAARKIHRVYEEVKPLARPVEGDPEAVSAVMARYRARVETELPELFWREVPFYYDPDKPHAEQRGYDVMAEAVARAVVDAPKGVVLAPVQSTFGWHVLVKMDHVPRSRKGPSDPEVVADIRKNALLSARQAWFGQALEGLLQQHRVVLHPEALELLQPQPL